MPQSGPLVLRMMEPIVTAGNAEGPEIYRLVRSLTIARMRQAGVRVDFDGQPDAVVLSHLKPGADSQMLARLLALEQAGTGRGHCHHFLVAKPVPRAAAAAGGDCRAPAAAATR